VIITDSGVAPYAPSDELERIAIETRSVLVSQGATAAFAAAFDALREVLTRREFVRVDRPRNELDDAVLGESRP
jgi:uncharacterized membrane protein